MRTRELFERYPKMLNLKKPIEQWGPIDARHLYVSFWLDLICDKFPRKYNVNWAELLGVFDRETATFFWEKDALERHGSASIRHWLLQPAKRKKLIHDYHRNVASLRNIAATEKKWPTLTPDAFAKLVHQWYQRFSLFWDLTFVYEIANYASPKYLDTLLRPYVPADQRSRVLEVLLTPERLSFHQQAEKELLECVLSSRDQGTLRKKLRVHATAWYWLDNNYHTAKHLHVSDFVARVCLLKKKDAAEKLAAIRAYVPDLRKKKKALARQYHVPSAVMHKAAVLAEFIWWQDHRKGVAWRANGVISKISSHIARRYHVSADDLAYYSASEWLNVVEQNKRIPQNVLAQRKRYFVLKAHGRDSKIFYGQHARRLAKPLFSLHQQKHGNVIHGIVVSRGRGKIQGTVHVLASPRQANTMRNGDILVAAMTSPDYIHAMRKAAAVVTDTGGLMSHAAVVSRELGIPCIVGTKIATKVLHDGDMVEVDAEHGTIRKVH